MIGIGDMYRCSQKTTSCGIDGYQVARKYQDTHPNKKNSIKDSKDDTKRLLKRGHYLEDYAKIHGEVPGPGVYETANGNWERGTKSANKKRPAKKQTYIQELMEKEKKKARPGPGQYKLFKDQKEIKEERKKLAHRKVNVQDRFTYLDAVQYEASTTPGVGEYNTSRPRPKSATMHRKESKKTTSRPSSAFRKDKQPPVGTYNPKIEEPKSFARKGKGWHEWGHIDRFKDQKGGSNLGPGFYPAAEETKTGGRNHAKSVYYQ